MRDDVQLLLKLVTFATPLCPKLVSVSCGNLRIYEAGVKWSPSRQSRHMLSIASARSSTEHLKRDNVTM